MNTSSERSLLKTVKREMHLIALLAIAGFLLYALFSMDLGAREGFVSSEVQFADASPGGTLIVPASCPSYPHYAGQCGTTGGDNPTNPPAPPSGNACVIAASPSTIVTGGSAFLGWSSTYTIFGIPFSMSGSISPTVGTVAASGVTTVSPTQSTTYNGVFTPSGTVTGIPQSWLTPVQCSGTVTVLASNPGAGSCAQVPFCNGTSVYQQTTSCTNQFVTTCPYGCSGGQCVAASNPDAFISAVPALVRSGENTTVTWSSSNTASCQITVGGTSTGWGGTSGSQVSGGLTSQTIYTLTCLGLNGTTITETATVNIIPVFQEV